MEKQQRSIGVFGLFGGGNLGNEATLGSTQQALRVRFPGARIVLLSAPPPEEAEVGVVDTALPHDPFPLPLSTWNVGPWRWRRRLRSLLLRVTDPVRTLRMREIARGLDMLLIPGTGIADDFYQDPFEVPRLLARWCTVMSELGRPVRFLSIGAGPVVDPLSVRWLRDALSCADFRSYRDRPSLEFATSIGVDTTKDRVSPDLVFALSAGDGARAPAWPPRTVGLGVMGYRGWNVSSTEGERLYVGYVRRLVILAAAILSRGLDVRLLVGHRRDDERAVRDVMAALADRPDAQRGTLTAAAIRSHRDVMREASVVDVVIATRFHNVVLALLLGRPVISIEYGKKNSALLSEMGLAHYCHRAESFDPEVIVRQLDDLIALPAPPLETARSQLAQYRAALTVQYDTLVG